MDWMYLIVFAIGLALGYWGYTHFASTGKLY